MEFLIATKLMLTWRSLVSRSLVSTTIHHSKMAPASALFILYMQNGAQCSYCGSLVAIFPDHLCLCIMDYFYVSTHHSKMAPVVPPLSHTHKMALNIATMISLLWYIYHSHVLVLHF